MLLILPYLVIMLLLVILMFLKDRYSIFLTYIKIYETGLVKYINWANVVPTQEVRNERKKYR